MREIKFRGMSVNGWVYGHYVVITDGLGGLVECIQEVGNDGAIPVSKETVSQYTGLKDKNGTEIYGGDVCKSNFGVWNGKIDERIFVIYWHGVYGSWASAENWNDYKSGTSVGNPHGLPTKSIEIIGNIYENPELLECEK